SGGSEQPVAAGPNAVTIVGAGVAGSALAWSLRKRGVDVTVIDRHGHPAREASGNPEAAILPYLSGERDARHRFYVAAFQYLLRALGELQFEWNQCGAVYFPFRERQAELLNQLPDFGFPAEFFRIVSADEAGPISGMRTGRQGMYFPLAGVVSL